LYERALAIREKVLGPDHPSTANGLNNLAVLLKDQGEFDTAKLLYERALKISEKVLGPEHPDTALRLHNLARLLEKQGDLVEAQQLLSRSLAISEKTLGPKHPQTAVYLNNLAALLRDKGDFDIAQPLFERAIKIWDDAEHPYASLGRTHLARLFLAIDDAANAMAFAKAALVAHDKMFGPNHLRTRESAGVTADALDRSGYVEEAVALREKYGITDPNN
jgi:tetratricopeptide (TPR) repeat protein